MAKDRSDEDIKLRAMYGLDEGLHHVSAWQKYMSAPSPKERKLVRFLQRRTRDQLVLVAAVTYAGMDFKFQRRAQPLEEMIEHYEKSSDLIYSIAKRGALAEYITAGIEAYTVAGD
ncbi:MAG: hypothetical protein ACLP5H_27770 [Desulfomonilaceae bacterium]